MLSNNIRHDLTDFELSFNTKTNPHKPIFRGLITKRSHWPGKPGKPGQTTLFGGHQNQILISYDLAKNELDFIMP